MPELPPVAANLVALIGKRLALALMSSTTRGNVYVPLRPKPSSKLVQTIGMAATLRLCEVYGGRTIHIPQCAATHRVKRDAEIRQLAADGIPHSQIALRFGLTDRQIRNVLAAPHHQGTSRGGGACGPNGAATNAL